MQGVLNEKAECEDVQSEVIQGVIVGKLLSMEDNGHIFVDYQDNPFGPLSARSTVHVTRGDENKDLLLIFEKNDPQFPIIIGLIQDQPVVKSSFKEITLDKKDIKDVFVDSENIIFDAKKEIILRCGKGSITIHKDGKIIIKGTNLISRSKGMNKIKGATIKIN